MAKKAKTIAEYKTELAAANKQITAAKQAERSAKTQVTNLSKEKAELEAQLATLEGEKQQLLEANEQLMDNQLTEEKIEEIRAEQLKEFEKLVEQEEKKAKEQAAKDADKEKKEKIVPTFTPSQTITKNGDLYTWVQNPKNALGRFSKEEAETMANLYKNQGVKTSIEKLPKKNQKEGETLIYFLYRSVTVTQAAPVAFKQPTPANDGEE